MKLHPRRKAILGCLALAAWLGAPPVRAQDEAMVPQVFKLEHQNAEVVVRAIRHLGSGAKDARLEANEALDTITVRDRASNVAAIEQAIKRLDVERPDVVFNMRLLIAGPQGPGDVPADMKKIVRQLEQNLRFGGYYQVAALNQRVRSGARVESRGSLQITAPALEKNARVGYELELRPVVTGTRKGARTVQMRTLRFDLEGRDVGRANIRTDIAIPEGEIVVVGTAALGDRAMVLVVWASPI